VRHDAREREKPQGHHVDREIAKRVDRVELRAIRIDAVRHQPGADHHRDRKQYRRLPRLRPLAQRESRERDVDGKQRSREGYSNGFWSVVEREQIRIL
jgi:hypothetical protein